MPRKRVRVTKPQYFTDLDVQPGCSNSEKRRTSVRKYSKSNTKSIASTPIQRGISIGDSNDQYHRNEILQILDESDTEIQIEHGAVLFDQSEFDNELSLTSLTNGLATATENVQNEEVLVGDEKSDSDLDLAENTTPQPIRKKKSELKNNRRPKPQGRKQDNVWSNFFKKTVTKDGKPITIWSCNFCDQTVSAQAPRLRCHYSKCSVRLKKQQSIQPKREIPICRRFESEAESPDSPPSNPHITQQQITLFVDRTSQTKKESLDLKLAKFLFSANLPFRTVENEEFKEWVKEMRCTYKPPSEEQIAGKLLDNAYEEISRQVTAALSGKNVTIQQDGWSTTQNNPIIAHSVSLGAKSYFMKAISTGTNVKSAEYCQELLEAEIDRIEQIYKCNVIACITDNCNVMKCLRENISKKNPDLYVFGCNSHLLNLVGQDFTPTELKNKVVKIQNYFRNTHYASASLSEKKGLRPVVPGDTRWCSQLDCFESFKKNHTKYLDISREKNCKMTEEIKRLVEDNKLYEDVQNTTSILHPVAKALDKLQKDQSTAADAVAAWLQLEIDLKSVSEHPAFQNRMNMAVVDSSIAAHMLSPKYRGRGLSAKLLSLGNSWLGSKSPFYIIAAANLNQGDTSFYPATLLDEVVSENMNPCNWWVAVGREFRLPKGLLDLATTLMQLPSSTGGIERCFSTLATIMSKRRNRLEIEKGSKLCFVNQYLKANKRGEVYIEGTNLE